MEKRGKLAFLNPTNAPKMILFYCPGCKESHGLNDTWTWNNNTEQPTFKPSVLARGVKMTAKGESDYEEWRRSGCPNRTEPFDSIPTVCHSWVTDGKIQYLSDCTHELSGQTVDMVDYP